MSGYNTEDTDPMSPDAVFVKKKEQTPEPEWTGRYYVPVETTPQMYPDGDGFSPVLMEPPSDGVANRPKKRGFSRYERRVRRPETPETPPRSNDPRLRDFTEHEIESLTPSEIESLGNAKR